MLNQSEATIDRMPKGTQTTTNNGSAAIRKGERTRRLFSYCGRAALGSAVAALSLSAQTASSPGVQEVSIGAHTVHTEVAKATAVEQFWTAERLLSAKAIEPALRVAADGRPMVSDTPAAFSGSAVKGSGGLPSVRPDASLRKTLISASALAESRAESNVDDALSVIPDATSSFGAHFTTSRVFPDSTTVAYPYRTAGRLYFHDPVTGGNFLCSASVLRPRIIATAGHCVTHPSTSPFFRYFYSNFLFVPAYNNGSAPYGTWAPSQEWITNTWYFSDGSVPNPQDVGILIARDQSTKLGYITGWLGYFTNQLGNNNVTMLGYPCNLDSCLKMQETFAQTFEYGGNNTYIYGSAMKGGASGGPWVQDFGIAPAGAPAGLLGNNYLVGVTSYQPTNTSLMYLGASNLDQDFLNLLNSACNAAAGNCN
jgi:V8-like Glu-specific endopeptidase